MSAPGGGGCLLPGVGVSALGGSAPGGVSVPGGGWHPSMHWGRPPPPVNRMTNRCKNITLATTSLRPVKILTCWSHEYNLPNFCSTLHVSILEETPWIYFTDQYHNTCKDSPTSLQNPSSRKRTTIWERKPRNVRINTNLPRTPNASINRTRFSLKCSLGDVWVKQVVVDSLGYLPITSNTIILSFW